MTFAGRLLLLINLATAALSTATASEQLLTQTRKAFLQAEEYINHGRDDDYYTLSETLKNYPLYAYLQYQWLKKHIGDDKAVLVFLDEFDKSRYAALLRHKWLLELGKKWQWQTLIAHYRSSDDAELQCFYAEAQYQTGKQQEALDSARRLWLSGKTQPSACDSLFAFFKKPPSFNSVLIWQRFEAALTLNNISLAKQMMSLLPLQEQANAELWLKLHGSPSLVSEAGNWKHTYAKAGLLFAHAIVRWLDSEPSLALQTWDKEKQNFSIPLDVAAETEKRLAMGLAFRRDSRAYERLSLLAGNDNSTREWRVRSALIQQNWQHVNTALDALSAEERKEDKWRYWRARALSSTSETQTAQAIYQQLANNRSLYGFLAADRLRQNINLSDQPIKISDSEIRQLAQQYNFQVVAELLAVHRKPEAKRQWWFAIAGLDQQSLLIAAKLAQQWQLPDMAIFTVAKTNHWDDMDLRFPMQYSTQIHEYAEIQKIDPALLFGIIRQESAFDELAESPVGAKGLMQLMPETAQHIARDLKDGWNNETSLFNPDVNIKYGSFQGEFSLL